LSIKNRLERLCAAVKSNATTTRIKSLFPHSFLYCFL
jgi:hypothetical protein